MHDVIIIGGGPAGLQAAQTLGRMHRRVLLLDSGSYRNAAAERMHNFLGRDVLPEIPGIADLWGTVVAHCPFCHGHEFGGGVVAVQDGPDAERVVVLDAGLIHSLEPYEDGAVVHMKDDQEVVVDGFFVASTFEQAAPFGADLELATLRSGCIEVDAFGRTSRPGVYAAGDLAHTAAFPMPLASVLTAAAAGLVAGASCVQEGIAAVPA